jgi:hypothetical protein
MSAQDALKKQKHIPFRVHDVIGGGEKQLPIKQNKGEKIKNIKLI